MKPAPSALSLSQPVARRRPSIECRRVCLVAAVHAAALAALAFPSWQGAAALGVGWVLTGGLGVSVGYHRGLCHNAFGARPFVRALLALFGALSLQGGPISWVGLHRAHHRFADRLADPYGSSGGFWGRHFWWALHEAPGGAHPSRMRALAARLEREAALRWLERHHLLLNVGACALGVLLLGPAVALWAFPLRIVLVWHLTWLSNSVGHHAAPGEGGQEMSTRNVSWLGLLSFGEGLHENHHRVPGSPRFSLPGQVDPGYGLLRGLRALRLVSFRESRMPNSYIATDASLAGISRNARSVGTAL